MFHNVLEWVVGIAATLMTALLGFIALKIRALPAWLLRVAANMQAEAAKTPGIGDDVGAAFLSVFAKALGAAFGQTGTPPIIGGSATKTAPPALDVSISSDDGRVKAGRDLAAAIATTAATSPNTPPFKVPPR